MGQVVGKSTPRAEAPRADPVTIENLLATVLHVLFGEQTQQLAQGLPRAVAVTVERARPIAQLI